MCFLGKDNLDNFLGHYTSARFSTCISSAINAQPMQAMYLPSQVHGNLLRFMFGIEVGLEGHRLLSGVLFIDVHCQAIMQKYSELSTLIVSP